MNYKVIWTSQFKKDYKKAMKRGLKISLLDEIIRTITKGESLPQKNKDHLLSGTWTGFHECHIQPDWLLIYRIDDNAIILTLTRTGSHSDLF